MAVARDLTPAQAWATFSANLGRLSDTWGSAYSPSHPDISKASLKLTVLDRDTTITCGQQYLLISEDHAHVCLTMSRIYSDAMRCVRKPWPGQAA